MKRRINAHIANDKKLKLLTMLQRQGEDIQKAAHSLNINYSTAKTILYLYRANKQHEMYKCLNSQLPSLQADYSTLTSKKVNKIAIYSNGKQKYPVEYVKQEYISSQSEFNQENIGSEAKRQNKAQIQQQFN